MNASAASVLARLLAPVLAFSLACLVVAVRGVVSGNGSGSLKRCSCSSCGCFDGRAGKNDEFPFNSLSSPSAFKFFLLMQKNLLNKPCIRFCRMRIGVVAKDVFFDHVSI